MIKGLSAITKYRNGITKIKATDKLSVKSIILPDVHESDDSTINFTKRVGGEMIQCYSLSEVKLKQPDLCIPTFKEIIFKPCRASSVTTEVFCEPSVLSFSTVKILDCDISFTTRNTTMMADYDYETNQYLDPVADSYPLPLTLSLTNLEGSWWIKRNSEFLYSSDNLSPNEYGEIPGIYYDEEGDVFYLDLGHGGTGPVNAYEFKGKTNILELFIQSSGSSDPEYDGTVDVDFYETLRIKSFKFSLKAIVLSVPNYLPKGVTSLKEMFLGSNSLRGDLSTWDTSRVTNMESTFSGCDIFLSDLSSWDVSKVTNMRSTFNNANLSSDLSSWDTSKVVDMYSLFMFCPLFNSNISNWNTSLVTNMGEMFWGASLFNQDISQWDVSKVTNMDYMFADAYKFTGDISSWCVSNISTEPYAFYIEHPEIVDFWPVSRRPQWGTCPSEGDGDGDGELNGDPNDLGVSDLGEPYVFSTTNVATPTSELMLSIEMYNYTKWQLVDTDTGLVIANSRGYFAPDIRDNQSQSNVASVQLRRSKTGVSNYALYVKSDSVTFSKQGGGDTVVGTFSLTQWGTMSPNPRFMLNGVTTTVPDTLSEAVTSADLMFSRNNLFNQDISSWETGHLVSATSMFDSATSFNQDLSGWCVTLIPTKPDTFDTAATSWTLPKPVWGTCPERLPTPSL